MMRVYQAAGGMPSGMGGMPGAGASGAPGSGGVEDLDWAVINSKALL